MIYQNIKHLLFSLEYEKIPRKLMIKENSPSLRKACVTKISSSKHCCPL